MSLLNKKYSNNNKKNSFFLHKLPDSKRTWKLTSTANTIFRLCVQKCINYSM